MYFNKDCLEILPTIPDKSVDLIFCDLPYHSTNCKWDCAIDLDKLWVELKRIRKDTTPIVMTCTTKFGYELISSNPKEFKFDMVWQKSRKCGFLQARKRPLCNHEMVYFFYKKQPKYNYLKYHKYTKKIKKKDEKGNGRKANSTYGSLDGVSNSNSGAYEPRLPASVIVNDDGVYGEEKRPADRCRTQMYDPALPASVIEEKDYLYTKAANHYKGETAHKIGGPSYTPPLPASVIGMNNGGKGIYKRLVNKNGEAQFKDITPLVYEPPLPASVLKGGNLYTEHDLERRHDSYDPLLPTSIQPFKSTKPSKHQTGKPVDLMEFILKYWTDEGDTVFDPTFGGGSMPIACKKLNRKFIGCEMDEKFYNDFILLINS